MSPFSSPNVRNTLTLVGIALTVLAGAIGFGTLKAEVGHNTTAIHELRVEVAEAKTNVGASAAGASLQAQIRAIDERLNRIEAQNVEILRLLTRRP